MAKIKFTLAHPIEVKGLGLVRVLEVRDVPTVGDLLVATKAGGTQLEQDLVLYSRLCGLDKADLELLSLTDWNGLVGILAPKAEAGSNPSTPAS